MSLVRFPFARYIKIYEIFFASTLRNKALSTLDKFATCQNLPGRENHCQNLYLECLKQHFHCEIHDHDRHNSAFNTARPCQLSNSHAPINTGLRQSDLEKQVSALPASNVLNCDVLSLHLRIQLSLSTSQLWSYPPHYISAIPGGTLSATSNTPIFVSEASWQAAQPTLVFPKRLSLIILLLHCCLFLLRSLLLHSPPYPTHFLLHLLLPHLTRSELFNGMHEDFTSEARNFTSPRSFPLT